MELTKLSQLSQGAVLTVILLSTLYLFVALIHYKPWNNKKTSHGSDLSDLPPPLPPSPPSLPLIGNLHQLGPHLDRSLRSLAEKHGSQSDGGGLMLLRLGSVPTVVVSAPSVVQEIAKRHDAVFSDRYTSTASDAIYHGGNDIVFAYCGDFWRKARKLCVTELLSPRRVQSFHSVREDEADSLVEKIRDFAAVKEEEEAAIDLCTMLISASNSVISRCIFGRQFGGTNERLGELVRRVMVQLMAFSVGDYFPALKWVDSVRGFVKELRSSVGNLDAFYTQVVEEHEKSKGRGNGGDVKNFVDILLELQKSNEVGLEITNDHLKAILQDMFFGGIETTSTLSEWFMAELMRKPSVMRRVQEEVRRVVGKKAKVEMRDLDKMEYFKCAIKETLRLHPPAPLLVPRKTTDAVEVNGYLIPKGVRVLINAWAVQRHPGWWENPEEFIPERFENSPVDYKGQEFFQFIPFGFGRRRCPAIRFGMVGTEFLCASLLYWFDWKLPSDVKELDMSEVYGIAVHKKVPLRLIPIPYSP